MESKLEMMKEKRCTYYDLSPQCFLSSSHQINLYLMNNSTSQPTSL